MKGLHVEYRGQGDREGWIVVDECGKVVGGPFTHPDDASLHRDFLLGQRYILMPLVDVRNMKQSGFLHVFFWSLAEARKAKLSVYESTGIPTQILDRRTGEVVQ